MKTREIKFRMWSGKAKKYFYDSDNVYGCLQNSKVKEWAKDYEDMVWQQFTGLKDKNGKDIYEGDVIKYSRLFEASPNEPAHIKELTSFIRYESAKFGFDLKGFNDMFYDLSDEYNVEVIGNIFENKDLLCDHMNSHISVNGNCYNCGKLIFPKK